MQDIFISNVKRHLDGWQQAFPGSLLFKTFSELPDVSNAQLAQSDVLIFWLHVNGKLDDVSIKAILRRYPASKVMVLDNAPDQEQAIRALGAGASGYAHAYSSAEQLIEIRAVISHGGVWLGPQLLQHLIEASTRLTANRPEAVTALLEQLTHREREVALEAAKGLSNKEIARKLNITERTVKAHLAAVFVRLEIKDRLQLALMLNQKTQPQDMNAKLNTKLNTKSDNENGSASTEISSVRKAKPKKKHNLTEPLPF